MKGGDVLWLSPEGIPGVSGFPEGKLIVPCPGVRSEKGQPEMRRAKEDGFTGEG